MIQIKDKIISLDIFEIKFVCNLEGCRGKCCVYGYSGAPLSEEETFILEKDYNRIRPYLSEKGNKAVLDQGNWISDKDGDKVTPLIDGLECAYAVFENGIAKCGIENAWKAGKTAFRKPVSCHLYPIRLSKLGSVTALNYDQWSVCSPALKNGSLLDIPLYVFLKESIIRVFGQAFYSEMEKVARQLKNQ